MSTDFPVKSINWCLKKGRIKFENLDYIVVPWIHIKILIMCQGDGLMNLDGEVKC